MRLKTYIFGLTLWGLTSCQGMLGDLEDRTRQGALSNGQTLRGHLSASGSKRRSTSFQYDLLGRPVAVKHRIDGTTYAFAYEFGYAAGARQGNELGNILRDMTMPDDEKVVSAFDAIGNVQEVNSVLEPLARERARAGSVIYKDRISGRTKLNRFGQLEWTESGDNTRTLRTYDSARRPLHVLTLKGATGEILQAFGYNYDKVGRVTQVRDYCSQTENGIVCCDPRESSCREGRLSATYEYDLSGWLKKMTSAQGSQEFSVDAIGNLLKKGSSRQAYGENGLPHALTSVVNENGQRVARYSYNPMGAMESMEEDGVTTRFVWNAHNMPTRTEKNGNVTERFYVGESLFKRVDTVNGQTTTTLFLPGVRIENGTYRKFYGSMAERESMPSLTGTVAQRRGTLRFHHADHLGSSTLVTDENGNPVSRAAYLPFGEERFKEGSFTPKQQFTSKEKEEVSGLYDYGARLYNPRTGRFISADSVMDGLNPYSYVHNNPINMVDPSGHVATNVDDDVLLRVETWERAQNIVSRAWGGIKNFFKKFGGSSEKASGKGPLGQEVRSTEWYFNNGSYPRDPKMAGLASDPVTRGELRFMLNSGGIVMGGVGGVGGMLASGTFNAMDARVSGAGSGGTGFAFLLGATPWNKVTVLGKAFNWSRGSAIDIDVARGLASHIIENSTGLQGLGQLFKNANTTIADVHKFIGAVNPGLKYKYGYEIRVVNNSVEIPNLDKWLWEGQRANFGTIDEASGVIWMRSLGDAKQMVRELQHEYYALMLMKYLGIAKSELPRVSMNGAETILGSTHVGDDVFQRMFR